MENSIKRYQPKFGRVLIKREVKDKIGSIIIADAKRHAPCEGVIIALGETAGWAETYDETTRERIPIQTLEIGNHVLFGRHAGAWLDSNSASKDDDSGTLFICQDADILAVISKEQMNG